MKSIGERIEWARKRAGMSQRELGADPRIGVGQTAIDNLEKGRTKRGTKLEQIAQVLGVDFDWLERGLGDPFTGLSQILQRHETEQSMVSALGLEPPIVSRLPIYPATETADGTMHVITPAISYMTPPDVLKHLPTAWGLTVAGDSMAPAIKHGMTVLFHPSLPPNRGALCVLLSHPFDGRQPVECMVRCVVDWTATTWRVQHYHPATRTEEVVRRRWPNAHPIVAIYP